MPNPYLQDQAGQISRNLTQNWQENLLPSINSGAMMAGGFGGSRQGIAQGLGLGRTQQAIGDAQTNLYSNAYNTDQQLQAQRDMQANALAAQQAIASMQNDTNRFGLQNSYNLGLGGLGLQDKSLDNSYALQSRGLDLSQYGLGANLMNQGNQGLVNQGTQLYQSGQQEQNAPWATLGNYAGALSPFTGLNQSQSQTTPGPSTLQNLLAGGLTGAQIWQLLSGGPK